jgi:hypothetical protein
MHVTNRALRSALVYALAMGMATSATSVGSQPVPGDGLAEDPVPVPVPVPVPLTSPLLTVVGDAPALGVFDPSLVFPAEAPAGALSYSRVRAQNTISTGIAVSQDAGATWLHVADANAPVLNATVQTSAGPLTGNIVHGEMGEGVAKRADTPCKRAAHGTAPPSPPPPCSPEVSSLVYDPADDDPAARWKLFCHSYLVTGTATLHYQYGAIWMFASPNLTVWDGGTPVLGWNSDSPSSVGRQVGALLGPAGRCSSASCTPAVCAAPPAPARVCRACRVCARFAACAPRVASLACKLLGAGSFPACDLCPDAERLAGSVTVRRGGLHGAWCAADCGSGP